jgi:hypothetical protein
MSFFGKKFGLFIRNPYLCNLLLLIIGAFGRQSSMMCVAIISCSVSSLFGDGVTLRSGGMRVFLPNYQHKETGKNLEQKM